MFGNFRFGNRRVRHHARFAAELLTPMINRVLLFGLEPCAGLLVPGRAAWSYKNKAFQERVVDWTLQAVAFHESFDSGRINPLPLAIFFPQMRGPRAIGLDGVPANFISIDGNRRSLRR